MLSRDESPTDKGCPLVDTHSPETREQAPTSRRALLASLIAAGATVAVAGRASAADDAAPTTTAPPLHSDADTATLNSLIVREAAMVATYESAKASVSGDDLAVLELIESHHKAYVQALSGYLGRKAGATTAPALPVNAGGYATLAPQLARLEAATATTHIDALKSIQGLDAATLVASIITVEARHEAALLVSSGGSVDSVASGS